MSRRRKLLGEVNWLQITASVLAAVTAAWIASRLGVAGTLIGAAVGSFVVTISSAFYGRTLDHTRTLLIQTESGTVIERQVDDGEVREALDEAADVDSPARGAQFVDAEDDEDGARLHWKTIIVTTLMVLALAIAAISAYELVTGRTLDGDGGTTIGDTFGGKRDAPTPEPTTTTPATTEPTPTSTDTTISPTPTTIPTTTTTPTTTPTPTETTG